MISTMHVSKLDFLGLDSLKWVEYISSHAINLN